MDASEYYTCPACGGELLCNVAAKQYGGFPTRYSYTCEDCGHSQRMICFEDFEIDNRGRVCDDVSARLETFNRPAE